jgi:hypothetical protein
LAETRLLAPNESAIAEKAIHASFMIETLLCSL